MFSCAVLQIQRREYSPNRLSLPRRILELSRLFAPLVFLKILPLFPFLHQ